MTVIMIIEEFVIKPRFNLADNSSVVVPMNELPAIRWPAFVASHLGLLVGICTAGVVPGLESLCLGICSVQSWLVAAMVYYAMRVVEIKLEIKREGAAVGT